MAINIPFKHHGACSVALIALKGHPKRLYHYTKTTGQEESWCLRDYLGKAVVRAGRSTMTASQIEELVEYAEAPAYRPVNRISSWSADCKAASERHFGAAQVDLTTPNPATLGKWNHKNNW